MSEMPREMLSFMPIFWGAFAVVSAIGCVFSFALILQKGGENDGNGHESEGGLKP